MNEAHRQHGFAVCCEWGANGIAALADCKVFVIVDVLSFSTCVDIACARGAAVLPWAGGTDGAARHARQHRAQLASRQRTAAAPCLSPASLTTLAAGSRLVLPSPNGSTLSQMAADHGSVFCASLRNARAVAAEVNKIASGPVAVIAAGERWPDGTLRPAIEDWLGAGAVVTALTGERSPEAAQAEAAFAARAGQLPDFLSECASGRELYTRGFANDVALAAELYVSDAAPRLTGVAFSSSSSQ